MTTKASNPYSNYEMQCVQCGHELPVPEWSEYHNNRELHYLWHCWKCDYRFETIANVDSIEDHAALHKRRFPGSVRIGPELAAIRGRILSL
jgi:C4-type Zn-finger protein